MLNFYKYEATGNDFILIDLRQEVFSQQKLAELSRSAPKLCHRQEGIGADGILVLSQSKAHPYFMHVINADGSLAKMCGNGLRCVARHLIEFPDREELCLEIETLGGLQRAEVLSCQAKRWQIKIFVESVVLESQYELSVSDGQSSRIFSGQAVNIGNPHWVAEIQDEPQACIERWGKLLSQHPAHGQSVNAELIRSLSERSLEMAVFERGVGVTKACGTGCIAAVASFAAKHQLSAASLQIETAGGRLEVELPTATRPQYTLSGAVHRVFAGSLY